MRTLILAILLIITMPAQPEIFMQQGPDGIIYTDRPNQSDPVVELKAVDLTVIPPAATPTTKVEVMARDQAKKSDVYSELAIKAPEHDAIVRDNAGNVQVIIAISPDIHLKHGHQLVLYLDQQPIAHSASPTIQLTNLDRGSHTLQAQIESTQGKVIQVSAQILFHLQRYRLGQ